MQYQEIIQKYVEGKLVNGLDWLIEQLDKDPEVLSEISREKVCLRKFLCDINEQFSEFLSNPEEDARNSQDDSIFGDDEIAVGPGKETSVDFLEPPEEEDNGEFNGPLDEPEEDEDGPFA